MVDQRKNQRFQLHLPLRILRTGTGSVSHSAWTHNISSGGVLFTANAAVPAGNAIEFVVTLTTVRGVQVDLRCVGKVLRLDKTSATESSSFVVAATVDRYQFVRLEV